MDFKSLIGAKDFDELTLEAQQRHAAKNSKITNWNIGGIFRTLTQLAMQGIADLYGLLVKVAPMGFVQHAKNEWLDMNAAEVGVFRKEAKKTAGIVIFGRNDAGQAVRIDAGTIIKTDMTNDGEELRYFTTQTVIMPEGTLECEVPVTAEFAGARYNVAQGNIKNIVTYISGIDYVKNSASWVTEEGADTETDESLLQRCLLRWDELATGSTAAAYESWAKKINGVVDVSVNDRFPRGPGTVDITITGTNGVPTEELKAEVKAFIDTKRPLCSNILVKGPTRKVIDIEITIFAEALGDTDAVLINKASNLYAAMYIKDDDYPNIKPYKIGQDVIRARIIALMMSLPNIVNVTLNLANDIEIAADQIAVQGNTILNVERVM